MADKVSPEVRSRMMSGIRVRDTKPELFLRKGLHKAGFRYHLHAKRLPAKPDMVFAKYRAVIFVYGCFWHGHDCALFKWPMTRQDFWKSKINGNRERDTRTMAILSTLKWCVAVVWECALKSKLQKPIEEIIICVESWLSSTNSRLKIKGRKDIAD